MDIFEQYRKSSAAEFQRLVVVNKGTFTILLKKFEDKKNKYLNEKIFLLRVIYTENQLLIYILYLRKYHTYLNLVK